MTHYMRSSRPKEDHEMLERALMIFEPNKNFTEKLKNVKDIYYYKYELKSYGYDEETLEKCASLILRALQKKERFRKYDSIKVLKSQVISCQSSLPPQIVRILFEIYRNLIFTANDDMKWALSRLIKNQVLDESEIQWLISNWRRSAHLVNRILLYPVENKPIVKWARERFLDKALPERTSDLIAIIFSETEINNFHGIDSETVAWGIAKSRCDREVIERELIDMIKQLSSASIIGIARRLQSSKLIREAILLG
jgi:hypothetical protein